MRPTARNAWRATLVLVLGTASSCHTDQVPEEETAQAAGAPLEGMLEDGAVRRIQEALQREGYDAPVTGTVDVPTESALKEFQRDHDRPQTGLPDRETLRQLGFDPDDLLRAEPGEETFPEQPGG